MTARSPAGQRAFTYRELLEEVCGARRRHRRPGHRQGRPVIIYKPMVPEAAIAMLAFPVSAPSTRFVFGGFAAKELATRTTNATPDLINLRLLRHRAWAAWSPYKSPAARRRHRDGQAQGRKLHSCCSGSSRLTLVEDRDATMPMAVSRREIRRPPKVPCVPVAATDPASTFSTPRHDRPAQGRGA